ncbi:MAG TPA: lysophospholipid acyltransferase family protein, partial [Vicinamibacterales bacterium]|nr:lysophospholipid acyltransferase family protein [Vicinamibacterales bacterium]
RQPVMAFWHGRILTATFYFRRRGIVVITSENFDGEWIARIIERFGYGTARGSTSRGARKAMLQLVRAMREGKPAGFTLDGPRGPAQVAQPGAVWLARTTGNPVLPFHLEASRHWSMRSWDRTQVPKPFSTVALVVGEPMSVPADAEDGELERWRVELEVRLQALERKALELLNN